MAAFWKIKTNILRLKTGIAFLVFIFYFLLSQAQLTTLHGYDFETGVDTTLWYDSVPGTQTSTITQKTYVPLPFGFPLDDRQYHGVYVCVDGTVLFTDATDMTTNPAAFFPLDMNLFSLQAKAVFGYLNPLSMEILQTTVVNPGAAGHRVVVLQLGSGLSGNFTRHWQVQLHEEDYSITIVYGEKTDNLTILAHTGLMLDTSRMLYVDHDNHTLLPAWNHLYSSNWPGRGRYYRFTPSETLCPPPIEVTLGGALMGHAVTVTWRQLPFHSRYRVEYGPAGFAEGSGTVLWVTDTSVVLTDLAEDVDYAVLVSAVCPAGNSVYASAFFRTDCTVVTSNLINYTAIHSNAVACRTGTFRNPATLLSPPHIVDYGSSSSSSRHTVHTDTSERDPRTDSLLRTVPEGFCASVRLGNWLSGAEQESITYTMTVDTGLFDLLILRYALVEQNPNHGENDNPKFEFDITDVQGNRISDCYHGNFVSGFYTGWNTASGGDGTLLWRDWDAVGVDLAPLHGQTICVTLSNYDCSHGGHFAYAYFVLESAFKHITAASCGDEAENTFLAPEGFGYRWYAANDSAVTLSTSRGLHVTAAGDYCCDVTYQLSGQVCGFRMSTYAGGRFPHAAFVMQSLDSCGAARRFENLSVVARDEAATQLTVFPCDSYRWLFGDGDSSVETHPTHVFGEGTHTVTLYAMLADGACVDSVSQTFTVTRTHVTVFDTICADSYVLFYGQRLDSTGVFSFAEGCEATELHLEVLPVYDSVVYDTFGLGGMYGFGDSVFSRPGVYRSVFETRGGCDSVVTLHLSCVDERDTTVCVASLPVTWEGVTFYEAGSDTLRLVAGDSTLTLLVLHLHVLQPPRPSIEPVPTCILPGGHWVALPDTLCYRWSSVPLDTVLPVGWVIGGVQEGGMLLRPQDSTWYFLESDYCSGISCPLSDSLLLAPVYAVEAGMAVNPAVLTGDEMTITATDLTLEPHRRLWLVGGVPVSDTGGTVYYQAEAFDDSVDVVLVATTPTCADTARAVVPVRVQTLWFPNVFTPDAPENNLFRGYGVRVKDYELRVFTRWGDCIFQTKDITEGWDGTYLGVRSPVSAYLYVCRYTTLEGERRTVSGTVTLLR